jgi:hypothetical protein
MDNNTTNMNAKYLENNIDQLSEEYQFYFLGVLEALNFAQNASETPGEETGKTY